MTTFRQVIILGLTLATSISACGPNRFELFQGLSEADKELYTRSRQFMTDRQQERFLSAGTSDERVELIESLHIHERLAKFSAHERKAIMAQQLVPGMSPQAVMLSWGRPREIQRKRNGGLRSACWYYERADKQGKIRERKVFFFNGTVSEISP